MPLKPASLTRVILALVAIVLFSPGAWADSALRDMRGYVTSLEHYQVPGQWTVVMIWASDCHICNREAGSYSGFYTEHAGSDANIIGISIDGQQGKVAAEAFIERNGVIFPNLIGDMQAVADWYQAVTGQAFRATPTFVLFGPQGNVRAAQPGAVPTQIIERYIAAKS